MSLKNEAYETLFAFLKNDALLGLGVVLVGVAVQLVTLQQYFYAAVFFCLAFFTLGLRTFRKADEVMKRKSPTKKSKK